MYDSSLGCGIEMIKGYILYWFKASRSFWPIFTFDGKTDNKRFERKRKKPRIQIPFTLELEGSNIKTGKKTQCTLQRKTLKENNYHSNAE